MKELLLVAVVLAVAACDVKVNDKGLSLNLGRADATDEWTRSYTIDQGGRLEIVNANGLIEATRSDGPRIEVRAERRARAGSQEEAAQLLKRIEMREDVSATFVRLEARTADGATGFRSSFDVRYHISVPDGLGVSFRMANGDINVENIGGRIAASTTNGSITGSGLSGGVEMQSVNGRVQADLASVSGDVKLTTVNGAVRLDLPPDVKASLDAACVNGGISIDDVFKVDMRSEESRRRVNATLNGGGPRISASTVNGAVRVRARGARRAD